MKNILLFFLLLTSILNAFSLKEGYKLALENDIDFKVNQNNLKNIKYDQNIADSLLYPKVDFSAKVEASRRVKDKTSSPNEDLNKSDEYEFKFTQPIFDGFEASNEKNLQNERFKSAVYYLKESQEKVALEYAIAYVNTLREKDLLSLNKESLEISENIFNKVYKKVNYGYGTKLEYDEAKGNLVENKVNLKTQRINLKEAIENLKFYVQRDFDTSELVRPTFGITLPKNIEQATKTAYENNPSINVSKTNVKVAVFEEKKTTKDFYPNINLLSSYKLNNALYSEEYNEYKIGIELKYNLYNGGKDDLVHKKSLQNINDKQLLVRKSQYQVKNSLRLSWNNYNLNKEKNATLEQFLLVKKDILDATIKEFDLGLKNLNTLLDTHIEYIDVKKDLIRNTYDMLIAKYKILNSMGKLNDVLENKLPVLEKDNSSLIAKNILNDNSYIFNNDKDLKNKKIKILTYDRKNENLDRKENKPRFENISYINNIDENHINTSFKEKFLSASKDKYTINLALSDSEFKAQKLLDRYKLNDNAFFFSFRYKNPLQKVVMGIYNNREDAGKALKDLPKNLKKNKPVIEKISKKQNLYFKYNKSIKNKTYLVKRRDRFNFVKKKKLSENKTKFIPYKNLFNIRSI